MFNKKLIKKVQDSLDYTHKRINEETGDRCKNENHINKHIQENRTELREGDKVLKLRLEALEDFLGLSYAMPDMEEEYPCGQYYYEDGTSYGLLKSLRDLLDKNKKK